MTSDLEVTIPADLRSPIYLSLRQTCDGLVEHAAALLVDEDEGIAAGMYDPTQPDPWGREPAATAVEELRRQFVTTYAFSALVLGQDRGSADAAWADDLSSAKNQVRASRKEEREASLARADAER